MISFSPKSILVAAIAATVITVTAAPALAMNKQDLVAAMAKDAGISKSEASKALDSFTANTAKALKKGDRVSLVGFGSFTVVNRPARTGRNPQTGEPIKISAKKQVNFRAGKVLVDQVN